MGKLSSSGANDAVPFLQKCADAVVAFEAMRTRGRNKRERDCPCTLIRGQYVESIDDPLPLLMQSREFFGKERINLCVCAL